LLQWVQTCPHSAWIDEVFPKLAEGSEHLVYFESATSHVWKLTRPGIFGDSYYLLNELVNQKNDSPQEYLVRCRLWKTLFQFAPRAIGVTDLGQIVSLQLFITGRPPSQESTDSFLVAAGLAPRKQRLWIWKRSYPKFDIWIGDARADNFVESPDGIVPIDLRFWMTKPENTVPSRVV
jgi:hypothetical protein